MAVVRDDRHGRHRRADVDRRRRPVDGFRARDRLRFARLVEDALAELPPSFHDHLDGVLLVVQDVPPAPDDGLDTAEVPLGGCWTTTDPRRRGEPTTTLLLYRRPIEARAASRDDLLALVREVAVIELAEHLGIDDDRLDDLGWL